jgi:hypothetical protein
MTLQSTEPPPGGFFVFVCLIAYNHFHVEILVLKLP